MGKTNTVDDDDGSTVQSRAASTSLIRYKKQ